MRTMIKFLSAQSIAPIEIHRQLCQVYGPNVMINQIVRRWFRQFTADRQHVHDKELEGRPSIITEDFVELVREPRAQRFPYFLTPQEISVRLASAF